jgi:hypothetical protein
VGATRGCRPGPLLVRRLRVRHRAALGWGGTHRVVMANDKAVMYEYDPVLSGLDKAVAAAQAYCGERGKSAVPTVSGRDGVFPTQTFECR